MSAPRWNGERLAQALKRAGMRQADLARALDASPKEVHRWTKGTSPNGSTLLRIAHAVGVEPRELYDDPPPERDPEVAARMAEADPHAVARWCDELMSKASPEVVAMIEAVAIELKTNHNHTNGVER